MTYLKRLVLLLCTAGVCTLLGHAEVARAQPATLTKTALTVQLETALPLGPQQRMPLSAMLTTTEGAPIAGAWITFSVDGRRDGRARTDAQGRAAWRVRQKLALGSYTVQAVFEGSATARAARASFALPIELPTLTLQVGTQEVGQPLEVGVQLMRPGGAPLANAPVRVQINSARVGGGRTGADGTLTLRLHRNLPPGSYPVEVAFEGLPGLLPLQATSAITVTPAWLVVETVPRLAGARFALDGRVFVADTSGVARLAVERPGTYTLRVLPWKSDATGVHATFARWMDDQFVPQRRVQVPHTTRLQAGFDLSYQVRATFSDLSGQPVSAQLLSAVSVMSSDRVKYTLNGTQPRWLPGSRVVRLADGLEARSIGYVVAGAIVDGSNVINQGQQRFDPTLRQEWPIRLALYSTHFVVRDALFGFPTGSALQLTYPDGSTELRRLDSNGELSVGLLARGGYSAKVVAPGLSTVIPIALSRSQEVRLLVVSYLDMAVLGLFMALVALGLLFAGRPRLLVLLRRPRELVAELAQLLALHEWPTQLQRVRAVLGGARLQRTRRGRFPLRLLLRDPTVIVALLLMLVGLGGMAGLLRLTATTTYATPLEPPRRQVTAVPTVGVLEPPRRQERQATAIATAAPVLPTAAPVLPMAVPRTVLASDTRLRSGSTGAQVAQLQQRLRELGYFTYSENTGRFSALTLAAVRQFQTDRGLPVTGIVGPMTIEALNACGADCEISP